VSWFSTTATIAEGGYSDAFDSATGLRLLISPASSSAFDVVVQWPAADVTVEAVNTAPVDGTHNAPADNEAVIRVPANTSAVNVDLAARDDGTVSRDRTRTFTITQLRTPMSWTRATTGSTPTNYDDPACATTSTCSVWTASGGDAFTGAQISSSSAAATVTVTEDDIAYISVADESLLLSRPVDVHVPARVRYTTGGTHNIRMLAERTKTTLGVPVSDISWIEINTAASLGLRAGSLAISSVGGNPCLIRFAGDTFPASCDADPVPPAGNAPHPKIYYPSESQHRAWDAHYNEHGTPAPAEAAFWREFDRQWEANSVWSGGQGEWQACWTAETFAHTEPLYTTYGWYGPKAAMPSHVDTREQYPVEVASGDKNRWVGATETIAENCFTVS